MSISKKKCCVPGCMELGNSHETLHQFPNPSKDRNRFNQWVLSIGGDIIGLDNENIYKYRSVCHSHFEEKFCCRYNRLSNIAIPTLYLPGPIPKLTYGGKGSRRKDSTLATTASTSSATPLSSTSTDTSVSNPEFEKDALMQENIGVPRSLVTIIEEEHDYCHHEGRYPHDVAGASNEDTNAEYLADWDMLEDAVKSNEKQDKNPAFSENVNRQHASGISLDVLYENKEAAEKPIFKIPTTSHIVKVKPAAAKVNPQPQVKTRSAEIWRMKRTVLLEPMKTDIIKLASIQAQIPLINDPLEIDTGCENVDQEITIETNEDINASFDAIDDQSDDDYRPSGDEETSSSDDDNKIHDTSKKKEEYVQAITTSGQTIKVTNLTVLKKYGPCRCCLKEGTHSVVDISVVMEPLNIVPLTDPRVSALVCSDCAKFLQDAKTFRNMAAASEKTLLYKIPHDKDQSGICLKNIVQSAILLKKPVNMNQTVNAGSDFMRLDNKMDVASVEDLSPRAETPIDAHIPDSASKCDEMDFSELSDTDSVMTTVSKGPEKPLSAVELRQMVRISKKEEFESIRENFKILLKNSTIVPFITNLKKGFQFTCIYCNAGYKHFKELRQHMETHDKEDYDLDELLKRLAEGILRADVSCIKCKLCDETLPNIDILVEHLVKIHDKIYYDVPSNPPHKILGFDLSSDVMKCTVCGQGFDKFRNLIAHMNIHYGSHLCEECGTTFIYFERHRRHMLEHKIKLTTVVICDICGEKFKSKLDLNRHRPSHYPPSKRSRKKKYKALGMKDPRRLELVKDKTPECKICSTKFSCVEELYSHRLSHLRLSKEKIHKCDLCEFVTRHKNYLSEHFRRHWGIRKYQCRFCNSRWINLCDLKKHQRQHTAKLQCPLCETCFVSKEKFGLHLQTDHPYVIKTEIEQ